MNKPNLFRRIALYLLLLAPLWLPAQYVNDNETLLWTDTLVTFRPAQQPQHVDVRKIPDAAIENLTRKDAYWYANLSPERRHASKALNNNNFWWQQRWLGYLSRLIVIGIVVTAIVFLLKSGDIQLFKKQQPPVALPKEGLAVNDFFSTDISKEIAEAVAAGDWRQATRLLYWQSLKKLVDEKLLAYNSHTTNSQYVMQLRSTPYHQQFAQLTRIFEYVWYGNAPLTAATFNILHQQFVNFKPVPAS